MEDGEKASKPWPCTEGNVVAEPRRPHALTGLTR